jgi:hypothetical protein
MRELSKDDRLRCLERREGRRDLLRRRLTPVLLVLLLPFFIGAWKIMTGDTINPNLVGRIQDGKTTKNEILLFFGDPKEIQRTPEGPIYKYISYKDAPAMPYRPENRVPEDQSSVPFLLDDKHQVKKPPLKTEGQILRSTLTIRFKPDGETVMSHEYKEY